MKKSRRNSPTKQEMAVMLATGEPQIHKSLSAAITHILGKDNTLKFTITEHERDVRKAVSLHDYDLIVLFVNTMSFEGDGQYRFDRVLELIRELKHTIPTPIMLMTTFHPRGFATAVEQAGLDAFVDMPFTLQYLEDQVRGALEQHKNARMVETKAAKAERRRKTMRPRVLLLDDSSELLAMLNNVVRSCWERATIVTCTDSYAAWDELQHRPPDLFITDLIHGGIDGFQLLARLSEQEVAFPIVVLSGNLPEKEPEARAAAGSKLRVSYWEKPMNCAEFGKGIRRLLE